MHPAINAIRKSLFGRKDEEGVGGELGGLKDEFNRLLHQWDFHNNQTRQEYEYVERKVDYARKLKLLAGKEKVERWCTDRVIGRISLLVL